MDDDRLKFFLGQAEKAAISRDFYFAEKILTSREVEAVAGKDNPQVLLALGNLYHRAGNFDNALSVFQRLNELQPENAEVLNRLGTIYRRRGEHEKSLEALLRARSIGGDSAQLLYNLGNTYKEMHSYAEAEKCFMQAIELNPEDALAYNHIGTIEFLLGRYSRALNEYRNGLKIDPNHPFIHFNLARLHRLLNRSADSEREYIAALKSRPNWQKALEELASLYNLIGSLEKQAAVLARILSLDSENARVLLDSAETAGKLGRADEAKSLFKKALSAAASDPRPSEKFARFLSSIGEFAEAAEVIEAYNAANPGDKSLMLNLAELYMHLLRYSMAEKILKGYSKTGSSDVRFLQLSAKMYLALGDKRTAQQYLSQIISAEPGKIETRKEFAAQLAQAGLLQEAREQLKIYLKDNSEDSGARVLLGAIYEQDGDFENAIACYEAVIEKEKDNVRANAALSFLYLRMGKNADAVQLAGKILEEQSAAEAKDANLSLLRECIDLYERAVNRYSLSSSAVSKNLSVLARIKEQLNDSAENALVESELKEDARQAVSSEYAKNEEAQESPRPKEQNAREEATESEEVDLGSLLEVLGERAETAQNAGGFNKLAADAGESSDQEEGGEIDLDRLFEMLNRQAEAADLIPQDKEQFSEDTPLPEKGEESQAKRDAPAADFPKSAQHFIPVLPAQAFSQIQQAMKDAFPAPAQPAMPETSARLGQGAVHIEGKPAAAGATAFFAVPESGAAPQAESAGTIPQDRELFSEDTPIPESKEGTGSGITKEAVLDLLQYLKEAISFLPESLKEEYRQSRELVALEYAILKLSGKTGLHESVAAISAYENYASLQSESGETGLPPLSEIFSVLADLSAGLPDKDIARILSREASGIRERLAELEKESLNLMPPQA